MLFGSYLISILFTIGVWIVSMNNHVCGPITHERHGSLAIKEPEWYTKASVVISVCTEVNVACFKFKLKLKLKCLSPRKLSLVFRVGLDGTRNK